MIRLEIKPQWAIAGQIGRSPTLPKLLDLLAAIAAEGNLSKASVKAGMSYRHAWGLVRDGSQIFGAPLISYTRGQGAKLTLLAEKLVWANRRIGARLAPILESFASELEVELERALTDAKPMLRIHASHGYAIAALRDLLVRERVPVDLRYMGSLEALASLCRSNCEIAGLHVPQGELQTEALQMYLRWLKPAKHALIHLVTRRQGLIVAPENPKNLGSLADLTLPGIRFVNRQPSSGTRFLLDMLLRRQGINRQQISGYETSEYTHAAVAAYIASGMADVGLGVETAARQFHLGFVPLAYERYFLVCYQEALKTPAIESVLATLRGDTFRTRVAAIPGVDGSLCGTVASVQEAFPDLPDAVSRLETAASRRVRSAHS